MNLIFLFSVMKEAFSNKINKEYGAVLFLSQLFVGNSPEGWAFVKIEVWSANVAL